MMNTYETYVSLETANLLKQAGFDWDCRGIYVLDSENDTEPVFSTATFKYCGTEVEGYIKLPGPTLAVAQRWLREVKKLQVFVYSISQESWHWHILKPHQDLKDGIYEEDFYTYESALETGIKKCLELILKS